MNCNLCVYKDLIYISMLNLFHGFLYIVIIIILLLYAIKQFLLSPADEHNSIDGIALLLSHRN